MSSIQHQYLYYQLISHSYFYTLILLQCPETSTPNQTVYNNVYDECKVTDIFYIWPGMLLSFNFGILPSAEFQGIIICYSFIITFTMC